MVDDFATERLTFRPIGAGDVDLLVALDADPEVTRFITGGHASSRAEVEATVPRSLGHRWIASERTTGDFAGWFGLRPSTGEPERELGYRLPHAIWGHGYATEGARALVASAFASPGVERVWAQTMTVNVASRRVMEKCGLRYVRTFQLQWDEPIEGTELGDVEYELTRTELLARHVSLRPPSSESDRPDAQD